MKKICPCGKQFVFPKCREQSAKYCSIICLRKFREYGQNRKEQVIKMCACGKKFSVYPYRKNIAKYCSNKCREQYKPTGLTKGMKIPKGSYAKMGDKNPMFGKQLTKERKAKVGKSLRSYYDKIGRKTIEYKRAQKLALEYKRRAKIKGVFTFEEWENLKNQHNHTCPCCKKSEPEIKLTIDHIVPISKDGLNTIDNLQPLCIKCNRKKSTKIIKYEII